MNATHANAMNTHAAAGLLARLFLRERPSALSNVPMSMTSRRDSHDRV